MTQKDVQLNLKHKQMRKIFFFAFLLLLAGQIQAQTTQKVGHFNLNNFLVTLPEVREVDSLLQIYQGTLVDTMQQMDAKLKADVEAYKKDRNNLTAIQAQKKEQELMQADQNIKLYAQKAEQMMAIKKQELLTPILAKLDKIIKEIGKEGKYSLILDASMMNALLFAKESDDVTEMVRAKYNKM